MDPSVYFVETVLRCKVKSFFLSVDRGRDDPGVHGGDHLQQAGSTQEESVHLDVQQERRRLPEGRHQLLTVQVNIQLHQPHLTMSTCFVCCCSADSNLDLVFQ